MKFSVITPSFNQVEHLKLCAKSIADQTGSFELEHIVRDGAGGAEIEKWISSKPFAKVVCEPDSGMYDAINQGFENAQGDILSWLNCDEQYLPNTLDKVSRWFNQHPNHHILFGDVILVDKESQPLSYRKAMIPLRGHLRNCFLPTFSAATFVRRSIIDSGLLLSTEYRAISDAIWVDQILEAGFKAGVLNEPLSTFMQTGENLGQSELSFREGDHWNLATGSNRSLTKYLWKTIHRFRKLLSLSYIRRDARIQIYHPSSNDRVLRQRKIGGLWSSSIQDGK